MATTTAHDPELPEASRIGRNMQAAVYGTILTLSLVAVSSEYQDLPLRIMASVLATQFIFYVAHVYAGQLGIRLETQHAPTRGQLRQVAREEWPLLAAAGPPCLALLVGGLTGFKDATSVNVALIIGVVTLFLYGVRLGRAEKRTLPGVIMTATINGAFGLVIVVLKVLVH
ncbi:hypothetical protein LRS13_16990 [Svornostia abyssi]|uniref:Integral membrane protein n=1 Tax=Svornostia abyssi TaxID=2898438 RepID=A0ABY5PCN7_9ACTN|nr:hypothetical protein LRS13_16990 [Parviterribacteraceae bacterium J379]